MVLWVDQHRPPTLQDLSCHLDLSSRLIDMAENADDLPHLLLHGPSGAGKRTRILALLREIYGPSALKLRIDTKTFKHGTRTIDVNIVSSNYHLELSPGDAGIYDTFVVQDIIKEMAQTQSLGAVKNAKKFKILVLNETDKLTKNAQQALRRTMEKYVSTCRLILSCENLSKIINPLRSRCLLVRVPSPVKSEVKAVLSEVARKECFQLPDAFADKLVKVNGCNIRKCLLSLESSKAQSYPFSIEQEINRPDWEKMVVIIAKMLVQEQSAQRIMGIRSKFYDLLVNCVPPSSILSVRFFLENSLCRCYWMS